MENFSIALRIWAGTLGFNALFFCIYFVSDGLFDLIRGVFIVVIVAMFFTFPLIWPLNIFVRTSRRLPYRFTARVVWLVYIITLLNLVLMQVLYWILGEGWCFLDGECMVVLFVITASLVLTILFLKGAILKLYGRDASGSAMPQAVQSDL